MNSSHREKVETMRLNEKTGQQKSIFLFYAARIGLLPLFGCP